MTEVIDTNSSKSENKPPRIFFSRQVITALHFFVHHSIRKQNDHFRFLTSASETVTHRLKKAIGRSHCVCMRLEICDFTAFERTSRKIDKQTNRNKNWMGGRSATCRGNNNRISGTVKPGENGVKTPSRTTCHQPAIFEGQV